MAVIPLLANDQPSLERYKMISYAVFQLPFIGLLICSHDGEVI